MYLSCSRAGVQPAVGAAGAHQPPRQRCRCAGDAYGAGALQQQSQAAPLRTLSPAGRTQQRQGHAERSPATCQAVTWAAARSSWQWQCSTPSVACCASMCMSDSQGRVHLLRHWVSSASLMHAVRCAKYDCAGRHGPSQQQQLQQSPALLAVDVDLRTHSAATSQCNYRFAV